MRPVVAPESTRRCRLARCLFRRALDAGHTEHMANPNVQLVYEVMGAYLQGDEETLRRLIAPDCLLAERA
jgi:hypothetical protein